MRQIIYKVPNGKLLKIFVEAENGIISDIKITGDFFIHPEEKITLLENKLKGQNIHELGLVEKLDDFLKLESMEVYGFSSQDLCELLAKEL